MEIYGRYPPPKKKRTNHVVNCMIWIMNVNFFYLHRLHRNQPSPAHLQSQISPFLVILEVTQIVPRFLWVFHQCSHSVEPFHGVCFSDGLAWQNFWEIFSPPGNPRSFNTTGARRLVTNVTHWSWALELAKYNHKMSTRNGKLCEGDCHTVFNSPDKEQTYAIFAYSCWFSSDKRKKKYIYI